jgi:hypothetical protein
MELSPGVELVWWLASREAQRAKAGAVEPDHFFCALLSFAELSDSDLQTVATLDLAQEKLVELRDKLRWHLRLRELDTRTTALRHAVRRDAPQSNGSAVGATLHRSEATRQVFEAAGVLAREGHEKITPQHLLYALLNAPTPAITHALASVEAAEPAEALPPDPLAESLSLPETLVAQPRVSAPTPELDRYTRMVLPAAKSELGAAAVDLSAALAAETHSPRLLVCAPGTPLGALMAAAAQGVPSPGRVAVVVAADLPRDAWLRLLAEARRTATLLFVDLTQRERMVVELVVAALAEVVQDADGVLVAVQADHYHEVIQLKPELVNAFNPLWL